MDYLLDLFMNFLKCQSVCCVAVNGGTESSQISLKTSSSVFWRWTNVLWVWNDM